MGEVWCATDTNLGRQVAIKILPDAFAHDPERLARFEREAKTLASLNHPNIAQIYGLEKTDGIRALVMELVEGPTLADRIAQGPIPVDEALPIARQIAQALEAAHEQGIIHRDLKPANIKVRPDGTVKVLDFGLSKAMEPTGVMSPGLSQSPTITTPAMTQAGMILGTAAYMAPEQAKGRTVDRRADVWAFGCVLYEMLTGKPAFDGEDVAETLSAVLKSEPDWTLLPPELPREVRRLLGLCLEKDVKNRRSDAADVRLDIEGALQEPADSTAAPARSKRAWIVAGVMTLAFATLAAVYFSQQPASPPEMRLEITTPSTSAPLEFALSPNGRYIVFVASGDGPQRLWLRAMDQTAAQPMTGTEGAGHPFWSADSRSVGFFASGKLQRIDIAGGPPQALANAPAGRGGAWNPDGTILFAASQAGPLSRLPVKAGEPGVVTRIVQGQLSHRFPQFLPDGRHFLFFVQGSAATQGIYWGSLDGGEPRRLVASDTAGAWAPPDRLLFVRQGVLVATPFATETGEITGEPITVADPVGVDAGIYHGGFSVSADGRVAYRAGSERRQLTWFQRDGKRVGTAGAPDETGLFYPELSPDGSRVAVTRARVLQNNADEWLIDLARGGTATRFTFDRRLTTRRSGHRTERGSHSDRTARESMICM
jgi:serine/threonine protein kinase/Tol biopolymer transport system component